MRAGEAPVGIITLEATTDMQEMAVLVGPDGLATQDPTDRTVMVEVVFLTVPGKDTRRVTSVILPGNAMPGEEVATVARQTKEGYPITPREKAGTPAVTTQPTRIRLMAVAVTEEVQPGYLTPQG